MIFTLWERLYNYLFPAYYSVNDILKASTDVHVEHVSQYSSYGERSGYNGGVCAGLSTQHILMQLRAKDAEVTNPFHQRDNYTQSLELQNTSPSIPDRFKYPTILESRLQAREEISQPVDANLLKDSLEQSLAATQRDKHSRGILIFSEIRRNPYNGAGVTGGHALSMTIQHDNEEPVCTACDSNIFFAKAKGKGGCEEIVEKVSNTVSAYNPSRTYLSVVKSR